VGGLKNKRKIEILRNSFELNAITSKDIKNIDDNMN
jgi:hypothetical protein